MRNIGRGLDGVVLNSQHFIDVIDDQAKLETLGIDDDDALVLVNAALDLFFKGMQGGGDCLGGGHDVFADRVHALRIQIVTGGGAGLLGYVFIQSPHLSKGLGERLARTVESREPGTKLFGVTRCISRFSPEVFCVSQVW